jgi:trehalose utilization protein
MFNGISAPGQNASAYKDNACSGMLQCHNGVVFVSWFQGGEVIRSGCCYTRGLGRVFYFRPGHETYPTFHDANVRRVSANAV